MKKLLYLVPLALFVLCLTPWALHKDTVRFATQGAGLSPMHWRLRAYNVGDGTQGARNVFLTDQTVGKAVPPISDGARAYGFPFAFYLSNRGAGQNSHVDIQAVSWLWLAVDGLIILGTLILAAML